MNTVISAIAYFLCRVLAPWYLFSGLCFSDCEGALGVFSTLSHRSGYAWVSFPKFLLPRLLFASSSLEMSSFPFPTKSLPCFGFNSCGHLWRVSPLRLPTPLTFSSLRYTVCDGVSGLGHAALSRGPAGSRHGAFAGLLWAPPMTFTLPAETAPTFCLGPVCLCQSHSCWSTLLAQPVVGVSFMTSQHILCPSETATDCCHPVLTCPLLVQPAGSIRCCRPLPLCLVTPAWGAFTRSFPASSSLLLDPTPTQNAGAPTHNPPQKCRCPALAFHPVRDYFYNFLLSGLTSNSWGWNPNLPGFWDVGRACACSPTAECMCGLPCFSNLFP